MAKKSYVKITESEIDEALTSTLTSIGVVEKPSTLLKILMPAFLSYLSVKECGYTIQKLGSFWSLDTSKTDEPSMTISFQISAVFKSFLDDLKASKKEISLPQVLAYFGLTTDMNTEILEVADGSAQLL